MTRPELCNNASLRKSQLTQFVGTFDTTKLKCLDDALMVALGLLRS